MREEECAEVKEKSKGKRKRCGKTEKKMVIMKWRKSRNRRKGEKGKLLSNKDCAE
jgi:hypothetical protein